MVSGRGAFITGGDILMDGGGPASHFYVPSRRAGPTPKGDSVHW